MNPLGNNLDVKVRLRLGVYVISQLVKIQMESETCHKKSTQSKKKKTTSGQFSS